LEAPLLATGLFLLVPQAVDLAPQIRRPRVTLPVTPIAVLVRPTPNQALTSQVMVPIRPAYCSVQTPPGQTDGASLLHPLVAEQVVAHLVFHPRLRC
jgi:hypothetical protein